MFGGRVGDSSLELAKAPFLRLYRYFCPGSHKNLAFGLKLLADSLDTSIVSKMSGYQCWERSCYSIAKGKRDSDIRHPFQYYVASAQIVRSLRR